LPKLYAKFGLSNGLPIGIGVNSDFQRLCFWGAFFRRRGQIDFDARGRHLFRRYRKSPGTALRGPPRRQHGGENDFLSSRGAIANPERNHQRSGCLQRNLRWPSFRFAFRPFVPPCREKTSPASGGRETSRAPFANTPACPIWKSPSLNTPGLSREKYLRDPHPESNRVFLAATAEGSQEMV